MKNIKYFEEFINEELKILVQFHKMVDKFFILIFLYID